ncbi:MAG: hypothetical protein GX594_15725 [Pirellulaceae bacterium]|nr:hypothetical protein [Pirellulaceae bacterium]
MSIWNKILVGLTCFSSLFLFYFAARSLKTTEVWRVSADKHEARIKQLAEENERLINGHRNPDGTTVAGIRDLSVELHKLLIDRRRAWFHCIPNVKQLGREEGNAEILLAIENPSPPGIALKTVLYAFEDADTRNNGRYLGEFAVTNVDGNTITIMPTQKLTAREIDKLDKASKARNPWMLYELMPQDNRAIFAMLSDEEKRELLPAASVEEYIKDGKPASENDPHENVVDGKFVRSLIDYSVVFNFERERLTLLRDSMEILVRDKKMVLDALALARDQEEACKRDIASTTTEFAETTRQRDIVGAHRKKLEEKVAAMQEAVERFITMNKAMVGQIAKFQLEAAQRINERTRAMARSDSGRP